MRTQGRNSMSSFTIVRRTWSRKTNSLSLNFTVSQTPEDIWKCPMESDFAFMVKTGLLAKGNWTWYNRLWTWYRAEPGTELGTIFSVSILWAFYGHFIALFKKKKRRTTCMSFSDLIVTPASAHATPLQEGSRDLKQTSKVDHVFQIRLGSV